MNENLASQPSHEHAAHLLRDMTRAYHRYTAVESRQRRMGATELLALGCLRDKGSLTAGKLGSLLGLTSPSVTALIDRLDEAGYAHRRPHPYDRRSLLVELTPSGRSKAGTLVESLASEVASALEGMRSAEHETVVRFLGAITTCFERRADQAPLPARSAE